ncbi:MAG: indolepyruvate oxidoreductase subunit beta [Candidatus Aenigmarchaeota archaeon]|nr:indolepyruvate oxidoreductase subunit beta [Candidatus Aenigmarchaeota archaeon]
MKDFNIIVTGVGGLGAMTLGAVIAQAALRQGLDVRTSELHGLAQRGGSMLFHVRMGEKLYSPLIMQGKADVVIALEPLEALRTTYFGSKEHDTTFIIDSNQLSPTAVSVLGEKYPTMESIIKNVEKFSSKIDIVKATEIVAKETGSDVAANIFVFGYAVGKKLIPIEKKFAIQALEEIVPEKYLDMNKKVFEMGFNHK